jgi:autotransporter translocation and assembly factor TamB
LHTLPIEVDVSATGRWTLTLNSPLGAQAATLAIEEAGGTYSGTLTGSGAPSALEDLKVDGPSVSFAADADTPVGRMKLTVNGAIAGDCVSGKYGTPFGEFDFSGTRA